MKITDHRIYYKNLLYFIGLHVTSIFQEQKRKTTKKSKASYLFSLSFYHLLIHHLAKLLAFARLYGGFAKRYHFCQIV